MISERTLRKWRGDSLRGKTIEDTNPEELIPKTRSSEIVTLHERILKLTQELLDQWLIRKPL